MFDARLRPLIDPPLNAMGRWLARRGIGANAITLLGALLGVGAGAMIGASQFVPGLILILASRLLDGLDGAVARATRLTDFGGFLDIVGDFVFYVAVPIGFGIADPANRLAALVLLGSFALTGTSFLAFATLAAKRGIATEEHGKKSFFYNTGLAEGAETIAVFVTMSLTPQHFAVLAWAYAGLCGVTVIQRCIIAHRTFADPSPQQRGH